MPDSEILKPEQPAIDTDSIEYLAKEEARYKVQKLQKEIKFLDYQNSKKWLKLEWVKALYGITGIFTAIIALITIWVSIIKWSDESKELRNAKKEEVLNRNISLIQDISPQKRIAAALTLKSLFELGDTIKNSQILMSLATTLAYEQDSYSRNVIVDVLRNTDFRKIDTSTLQSVLTYLIKSNRTLSTLNSNVSIKKIYTPSKDSTNYNIFDRLYSLDLVISSFLKKGIFINELNNLYFYETDLSKIKFPQNIDFSGSALIRTNLDSSTCNNCDFRNVNFYYSSLRNADFENSSFVQDFTYPYFKIDTLISRNKYFTAYFDYSNLKGTDFSGFLVNFIDAADKNNPKPYYVANFDSCNIEKADFSQVLCDVDKYNNLDNELQVMMLFDNSNWEKAKFSEKMQDFFTLTYNATRKR